jgi:protein-S-isoprenylcysteine O-methyltransferase Ste14
MPKLAVLAWLVFFAVAFVYRALHQFRLTRRSGIVLPRRDAPAAEWFATVLFVSSLVLSAGSTVLASMAPEIRVFAVPATPAVWLIAGSALYTFGLCATLGAQLAMGRSWRMGLEHKERTQLVAHGPFRFVRNPIYTAMLLGVAGITALAPSPAAIAAYGLLFGALELQVRAVEEPYLTRLHGDAYRAYAARTGRFVPGVGTLRDRTARLEF